MSETDPYKTISSPDDTRNPTTHKKTTNLCTPAKVQWSQNITNFTPESKFKAQHYAPPTRNRTVRSNSQKRSQSTSMRSNYAHSEQNHPQTKRYLIEADRLSQAEQMDFYLKNLEIKKASRKMRSLSAEHIRERKNINRAHKQEMKKFMRAWGQYFDGLKHTEKVIFNRFKDIQIVEVEKAKHHLFKLRNSAPKMSSRLLSLLKKEQMLKDQQCIQELKLVMKEKDQHIHDLQVKHESQVFRQVQITQIRLQSKQQTLYNSLMMRVQERSLDRKRIFEREKSRLVQKYHNVMGKLTHQQCLEMKRLERGVYASLTQSRV